MMIRTSDATATLRELATHDKSNPLAQALLTTGIREFESEAPYECIHLNRSNRFWLQPNVDDTDPETYDTLTSAEAVLNTYQDALKDSTLEDADLRERMRWVFVHLPNVTFDAEAPMLLTKDKPDMQGEWGTRLRFAEYCEHLALPFRTTFTFDVNLREGAFDITAVVPRPGCFAYLADDPETRNRAARVYALDMAGILAQGAFSAHAAIRHVQVRCHEQGSDGMLFSLLLTRDGIGDKRVSNALKLEIDELIQTGTLVATLDAEGWYLPLEDDGNRLAQLLECPERWVAPELKSGDVTPALTRYLGARSFSDLGINENAARTAAWEKLSLDENATLGETVGHLVALRNESADLTVAEAAMRLADALVNDTVDAHDSEAMRELFVNGTALDLACKKASQAFEEQNSFDMENALARLEAELEPLMECGLYLDDGQNRYRYFNSPAERLAFNLEEREAHPQETRPVCLVPDAYYNAHMQALRLHDALDHSAAALEHAEELCRVAPSTPDSFLSKVRLLEDNTQILEASDILKQLIERPVSHNSMAIAFYRLAYMQWKLGRTDLAVACYERAMEVFPPITHQALPELLDLLEAENDSTPALKRLTPEETRRALLEGGLPLGDEAALLERLAQASQALTDAEVFSLAWQITGFYADARRDDVAIDVYRSLRPSS